MTCELPGFKVLHHLGKGGMANVYLAEQDVLERKVALKVMSKSLAEDPTFGQRFLSEAKIASQLVHPNIVTVYDMGSHEGAYYLSMQYIEGRELKDLASTIDLSEKIRIVIDIAKALAFAASKGIVHRDVKPENIMIHDSDGHAVLMDFGIAKALESDLKVTQTGIAIGTPHYMSPEQAKGKKVDHRSDLYSLGAVLFYLLAGRVPYDGDSAVAIGIKHIADPIPKLPESLILLQPVINKVMAKRMSSRYQTANEFIDALTQLDLESLEYRYNLNTDDEAKAFTPVTGTTEIAQEEWVTLDTGVHQASEDRQVLESDVSHLFETEDRVFGRGRSIVSWTLLVLVVCGGILTALYYFQPDFAKPFLSELEARFGPQVQQVIDVLEGLLETFFSVF